MMDLNILWFILITVLFTGFFFLEGFDYGVGGILPFLSSDEKERGEVLRTITPVWDGNEVWMMENATYTILSPEGFASSASGMAPSASAALCPPSSGASPSRISSPASRSTRR